MAKLKTDNKLFANPQIFRALSAAREVEFEEEVSQTEGVERVGIPINLRSGLAGGAPCENSISTWFRRPVLCSSI